MAKIDNLGIVSVRLNDRKKISESRCCPQLEETSDVYDFRILLAFFSSLETSRRTMRRKDTAIPSSGECYNFFRRRHGGGLASSRTIYVSYILTRRPDFMPRNTVYWNPRFRISRTCIVVLVRPDEILLGHAAVVFKGTLRPTSQRNNRGCIF
jgi:hypothetical protein